MLAVFRFQRDSKVKIDLVGRVAENFTRLRRPVPMNTPNAWMNPWIAEWATVAVRAMFARCPRTLR
jgi:hypothetical protein